MKTAIIIAGATGVGKTSVACDIAKTLTGEIISADARQVYRGMTIGTAAPVESSIPHHMIGILDPDEKPTAKWWADECAAIMKYLHGSGKVPIIAGGTGLYIRALTDGLFDAPTPNPEIRQKLLDRAETGENLHAELEKLDPTAAMRIHLNNTVRIIRALEVCLSSGIPLSEHFSDTVSPTEDWTFLKFHLTRTRQELYDRIDRRTEAMFREGWIEEVRGLLEIGVTRDAPGMEAIGYREIFDFIHEGGDLDKIKEGIKQATRNYAKRQITWFRHQRGFMEIVLSEESNRVAVKKIISDYLTVQSLDTSPV